MNVLCPQNIFYKEVLQKLLLKCLYTMKGKVGTSYCEWL